MTAQGADVPEGDGQATARTAASPRTPDANVADANGAAIEVPAARERARSIPEAAVARLAVYLRALSSLAEQGITTVSSEELATAAGVNSAKLRKDLSYIGSYGTRGVGYEVEVLIGQIERTLGLTRKHSVAVVGIGNLGHALANYGGFPSRGFPVSALFDLDDDLVGVPVGGIPVSHIDDIVEVCFEREVTIGVIATPAQGAQEVCDRLVAGGVTCILNFAPIVLQVPEHVEVRKVDLAVEMQILSFHVARRQQETANAVDGAASSDGGPPGGGAGLPGEIDSANRMVERL
ncbi:redox-sensing transcriptional repressor Rex [Saccharopolyspora rhizosphaerae]|uniref:Redox-sensing transcriptional repressor Rex n=1 Tax=Saccharopolyspora rhizosphaerae TaxID=2492662 RepID=A0A426JIY2_9PSEU|nr:redox-sensing transcriptional repressor Rex [Saccharopolyspora rhizosphaerae]RRO13073.1 redox-sensing transcriptional repressor Rex [Saccharopolyspora rhizosphaerae]